MNTKWKDILPGDLIIFRKSIAMCLKVVDSHPYVRIVWMIVKDVAEFFCYAGNNSWTVHSESYIYSDLTHISQKERQND